MEGGMSGRVGRQKKPGSWETGSRAGGSTISIGSRMQPPNASGAATAHHNEPQAQRAGDQTESGGFGDGHDFDAYRIRHGSLFTIIHHRKIEVSTGIRSQACPLHVFCLIGISKEVL